MTRGRLRSVLLAVAMAAAAIPLSTAPVGASGDRESDYLALGDSVAFGFNPLLDLNNQANFIGYPTPVAAALDLNLTNPSCSGEATGGFISFTGVDNSCRFYRAHWPLHVKYTSTQLDYALSFLHQHRHTRLVTIGLGANDLFVLLDSCTNQVSGALDFACVQAGIPGLQAAIKANLDIIYGGIRNQAHYHHTLVALTYYSGNYADPIGTGLISAVNSVLAERTRHWGGIVADGFGAFAVASHNGDTCTAGLRIPLPDGTCDVHPTALGRDLLAAAVVAAVRGDREGDHQGDQGGTQQGD